MKKQILSEEVIREYVAYLHQEEYASQTIEKYERAVRAFRVWLTDAEVDREAVNAYKEYLQEKKVCAEYRKCNLGGAQRFI